MTPANYNPFVELAKSKRFWTMILTAVVSFIVSVVPGLASVRGELLTVFLVIGGLLVGGYSVEDAATALGAALIKKAAIENNVYAAQQAAEEAYKRTSDR